VGGWIVGRVSGRVVACILRDLQPYSCDLILRLVGCFVIMFYLDVVFSSPGMCW